MERIRKKHYVFHCLDVEGKKVRPKKIVYSGEKTVFKIFFQIHRDFLFKNRLGAAQSNFY